jgi:hypothetical protein
MYYTRWYIQFQALYHPFLKLFRQDAYLFPEESLDGFQPEYHHVIKVLLGHSPIMAGEGDGVCGSAETAFEHRLVMGHFVFGVEGQDDESLLFFTPKAVLEKARDIGGAGDLGVVGTGRHPTPGKLDGGE